MDQIIADQKHSIETLTANKYFYVSIPYYDHEVFKCNGIVGDDEHKNFYISHFIRESNNENTEVLIVQGYRGDRFDLNGNVAVGEDRHAFNQGDVTEFILETHNGRFSK